MTSSSSWQQFRHLDLFALTPIQGSPRLGGLKGSNMLVKREYERPIVIDYGSISDHTFGDALTGASAQPYSFNRPDVPSL